MADKKNVQTRFEIPRSFNESQRELLSDLIIERIIERTSEEGIDINSRPFRPKYSKSYVNSKEFKSAGKIAGTPNLFLTGEMLYSLQLIKSGTGYIIIGYDENEAIAEKVEGNQIGSYGGNPRASMARKFIGLPNKELNLLIEEVEERIFKERETNINKYIDSLFESEDG